MSRLFYTLIFVTISVLFLIAGLYLRGKCNVPDLENGLEEGRKSTNSRKNYRAYIVVVIAFIMSIATIMIGRTEIGHRYESVGKFIIILPIVALLNAMLNKRIRQFIISNIILLALLLYLMFIFVDLPKRAPVIGINDTDIKIGKTTVGDLNSEGFEIYIQEYVDPAAGYYELLTGGSFKKYANDRSVFLRKGFESMTDRFLYPRYLLVKEDNIIAEIGLYADEYNNKALEECKIVYFKLDRDFIKGLKSNAVSLKLNGMELLSPIKFEKLKEKFGEKLTSSSNWYLYQKDQYYSISWTTRSDHIFWNEYFSDIYYDEKNNMTAFELSTEIARDIQ